MLDVATGGRRHFVAFRLGRRGVGRRVAFRGAGRERPVQTDRALVEGIYVQLWFRHFEADIDAVLGGLLAAYARTWAVNNAKNGRRSSWNVVCPNLLLGRIDRDVRSRATVAEPDFPWNVERVRRAMQVEEVLAMAAIAFVAPIPNEKAPVSGFIENFACRSPPVPALDRKRPHRMRLGSRLVYPVDTGQSRRDRLMVGNK